MTFCRQIFRGVVFTCLLIYFISVTGVYPVAAEDMGSANIRTVTRNEELFDAEYPMVYGLENETAQDLINADIDRYVQQFYNSGEKKKHILYKTPSTNWNR